MIHYSIYDSSMIRSDVVKKEYLLKYLLNIYFIKYLLKIPLYIIVYCDKHML